MTYFYTISYDEDRDDFWGVVDVTIEGKCKELFVIDGTEEMCDYISTGVMKHIDDVDGLESFLKVQEYLAEDDSIILIDETLF